MLGDRTCPTCRATRSVDLALATAVCAACHTRFSTAGEMAIARLPSSSSYETRWFLLPLLGVFAVALGLIAVSELAAFVVWAGGSAATIALGGWHAWQSERANPLPPAAVLPSATTLPRRERPRRQLAPPR